MTMYKVRIRRYVSETLSDTRAWISTLGDKASTFTRQFVISLERNVLAYVYVSGTR